MGARSRGRPGRDPGNLVGRDRLLIATRDLMREHPPIKLHRRSIAQAAGVAPGLVTYYFHDEPTLIEAAARPIIEGYLQRLRASLDDAADLETGLRRLIELLLEIARVDGQLLDTYIRYMKEQDVQHRHDILAGAYGLIDALLRRGQESGAFRSVNTGFLATAIWGICKTVASLPELAAMLRGEGGGDAGLADLIVDLILRALQPDGNHQGAAAR